MRATSSRSTLEPRPPLNATVNGRSSSPSATLGEGMCRLNLESTCERKQVLQIATSAVHLCAKTPRRTCNTQNGARRVDPARFCTCGSSCRGRTVPCLKQTLFSDYRPRRKLCCSRGITSSGFSHMEARSRGDLRATGIFLTNAYTTPPTQVFEPRTNYMPCGSSPSSPRKERSSEKLREPLPAGVLVLLCIALQLCRHHVFTAKRGQNATAITTSGVIASH